MKKYIIDYRMINPPKDTNWGEWGKWNAYECKRDMDKAFATLTRKDSLWEYRIRTGTSDETVQ